MSYGYITKLNENVNREKYIVLAIALVMGVSLLGCGNSNLNSKNQIETQTTIEKQPTAKIPVEENSETIQEIAEENTTEQLLKIEANGNIFYADFEDNSSAIALKEKLSENPITINMHDYGNFEKVGDLPFELVTNDTQITTEAGDVILYQGNQLTIYYDENTWSFTKVAKIRDADSTLKDKLGDGDISVVLSLK